MSKRCLPWVLAASVAALAANALQNLVVSVPADASPVSQGTRPQANAALTHVLVIR
jgi:hypothetical protein